MKRDFKGTWRTHAVVQADHVVKVPRSPSLTALQAATLAINPCTAYRMLRDFVELQKGDYIIQNAANSAVGQYVIQLARVWGYRTVNIVRSR
jgi:trans-2-enoyl-CoA reductase